MFCAHKTVRKDPAGRSWKRSRGGGFITEQEQQKKRRIKNPFITIHFLFLSQKSPSGLQNAREMRILPYAKNPFITIHVLFLYIYIFSFYIYIYIYICIYIYRMRGAYGSMEYSCPNTLVGSIKLQVSFAKEPYKRDNILRKYGIQLPYGSMEYSCPNTFFLYILFFLFLSL